MKKLFAILCSLLFVISFCTPVYAASVNPQPFPGNDANSYTPPAGYIHYVIPDSGTEGSLTVTFNNTGAVDPTGSYSFTIVIGKEPGQDYTQVLSWSSNFPVYGVIVKGGNAFNLYQYDASVRGDTNLVSPNNASGHPASVSHVSIVFNPAELPPTPPTPTPTSTPTPTITPTPTPTPCPPSPSNCFIGIIIIFVIIAFFLIGILVGMIIICCMKYCDYHKNKCDCPKDDCDYPKDDCDCPHNDCIYPKDDCDDPDDKNMKY